MMRIVKGRRFDTIVHLASASSCRINPEIGDRAVGCEDDPIVDYCTDHGIAYLPWGPLAAKPFAPEAPLTSASGALARVAQQLGATPGQIALAWLLHRSPNIIPIPGTTSIAHLEENMAAGWLHLSDDQLAEFVGPA